jgi:hypothetical protein
MSRIVSCTSPRPAGDIAVRVVVLAVVLWTLAAFRPAAAANRLLFAGDGPVPKPVQDFAWRVIETRCAYQAFERRERSFWAYQTRSERVDGHMVYSIEIVSDLMWKRTEPAALISMTVVEDGGLRLAALTSRFITCEPSD